MANISDHKNQLSAFEEWNNILKEEVSELQETAQRYADGRIGETELNQLIEKIMNNFKDFMKKRSVMARSDATPFLTPSWCSSLENSASWIGGCRPSSFIRLVYAVCGREVETKLVEYLPGERTGFGELSGEQIKKIDALQGRFIRDEDKHTARLACLQNDMVDHASVALTKAPSGGADISCESSGLNANTIEEEHGPDMALLVEEADQQRLKAVEQIIDILTPSQAVYFLAFGKKVWLCMHEWGTT